MILIVDDEPENRETLKAALGREGWKCREASSATEALALLREDASIRLLITDMKMPGPMDGLDLLKSARLVRPDVQRLLVTAFGTVEDTVTAMKSGAFDVLAKPLKLKSLRETVARLLDRAPQQEEPATLPSPSVPRATPLMGQFSPAYARVMDLLRRAAPAQASVLFTGESGVGKSYLAKALHQWSDRREGPFVALNCAAIPEELLESELFGYEKGAFTGATQSRDGKVQAAHRGTLLLDEISDLSPNLQAKLLQVIQERKFYKLGSNREVTVDIRILAATNRSLPGLVAQGRFREDLLFRLRVIEIPVPPLRERKIDLLWLVPSLLNTLCEKNHLEPVRFTHPALARLWAYEWPGNIRELENVIESTLVLASPEELREGFLSESALPEPLRGTRPSDEESLETLRYTGMPDLATIERQAIEQALLVAGGNRRLAASLLGISERTLYRVLSSP